MYIAVCILVAPEDDITRVYFNRWKAVSLGNGILLHSIAEESTELRIEAHSLADVALE